MKFKSSKYNVTIDERKSDKSKLVFNTMTGALSWILPNLYAFLMAGDIGSIVNSIYSESLKKCGYIVPAFTDEFEQIYYKRCQYVFGKASKRRLFVIAPTLHCNLQCIYCYEDGHAPIPAASLEKMEDIYGFIVNEVEKCEKPQEIHITWFGGEPLLEIPKMEHFSQKLVSYCAQKDISYSAEIITNGILLSEDNICTLKSMCKISKMQITIDGTELFYTTYKKATSDQYKHLLAFLPILVENFSVAIRLNVSAENRFDILDMAKQLFSNETISKKSRIYLAPIKNYNENSSSLFHGLSCEDSYILKEEFYKLALQYKAQKSLAQLLPRAKAVFCGSMQNLNCAIDSNGYLYRCEHCLGKKEWIIGDVQNGFYHNRKDNIFLMRAISPKCKNCSLFPICANGCAADEIINNIKFDCLAFKNEIVQRAKWAAQTKN